MYYDYIHIHDCNRLSLNGKNSITIRPTMKYQMILGTNGSGKTTLMRLGFTPIPPDPSNFNPGGVWEVHVLDKGHRYQFRAEYAPKNRVYSFIKDGVELNESRGITTQLELVRLHLGYTKELDAFLSGEARFVSMSPQQRRDCCAMLASADFSYAFKQFARFRKGLSNAQAVSKFLQNRISEEKQRLIAPEDVDAMRSVIARSQESLNVLMRLPKSEVVADPFHVIEENYVQAAIQAIESWLMRPYPVTSVEGDSRSFQEQIEELEDRRKSLSGELRARGEVLAEVEQRIHRIEALLKSDPRALEESKNELQSALANIPEVSIGLPPELIVAHPQAVAALRSAVADIPPTQYTSRQLDEVGQSLLQRRTALNKAQFVLDSIQQKIEHIERCQEVTCPKCHTVFKPGVGEDEFEQLSSRRGKGHEYVDKLAGEVKELEAEYDEVSAAVKSLRALGEVRSRYLPEAPGLFAYIDACGGMELGRGLLEKLGLFQKEVELVELRKRLNNDLSAIESALERLKKEAVDYDSVKEEYRRAVDAYELTRKEAAIVKERFDKVVALKKTLDGWESEYDRLETYVQEVKRLISDYIAEKGDLLIDEEIKKTQTVLAINETALAENDLIETIIKDLEVQLEKNKVEEEAYRLLTDAMSPKTGLIAEQIVQQIGALVSGVNQMIKRVWGYPLYIEMAEIDGNDLDYKFPMRVEDVFRKDISEGSDSMMEIVNRAFVVTGYYSLDLTDYPLFLDEPGRTFDGVHSKNLIPLIKDLGDSDRFCQVIIISHDQDCQTAFPNSETIILDDRNIQYPHPYNEHVEFA